MAEAAAAGGHWVLPTLDGVDDGQVRAHVSIAVDTMEEVAAENIDLAVEAGGASLQQIARPGADSPLVFLSTGATTAVGFFTFANPSNATPNRATVTLNGESVSFDFGPPLVA